VTDDREIRREVNRAFRNAFGQAVAICVGILALIFAIALFSAAMWVVIAGGALFGVSLGAIWDAIKAPKWDPEDMPPP
jgi:uncharacterized membrane protein YdjX (TVP38/TMEM64 family)